MRGYGVCIGIGEMPILVRTESAEFARLLEDRYGPFVVKAGRAAEALEGRPASGESQAAKRDRRDDEPGGLTSGRDFRASNNGFPVAEFELEVELLPPGIMSDAEEARVRLEGGRWVMERGDFRAECDPKRRRGWVRQSPNRYSIDAVLRMLHSLILAQQGGFLVHAASAIRHGRAFLFAGVSGAGKTTISRLAPPDVLLLTDEISYVRETRIQESGVRGQESGVSTRRLAPAYVAYGTPFAGELARIGENLRAPIAALYLLRQGPVNQIEPLGAGEAARALLQNILFFAHDEELVGRVFESASDFVNRVPVSRLVFTPDARVWELID